MNAFDGAFAVVTGAERPFGRRLAERFALAGAQVAACAPAVEPGLETWARGLPGGHGHALIPFDMSEESAVATGFKAIAAWSKQVDVLVNAAAVGGEGAFATTSMADMRAAFEATYVGQIHLTQQVLRLMARRRSGAVVTLISAHGLHPSAGAHAEGATHAALAWSIAALAEETAGLGVRIDGVAADEAAAPDDVAEMALFLASGRSSAASGQIVRIGARRAE